MEEFMRSVLECMFSVKLIAWISALAPIIPIYYFWSTIFGMMKDHCKMAEKVLEEDD